MELHRRKNLRLVVTNRQKEILIGSLLGDAYITRRGQIQFEQSTHQKEYLFWKKKELETISYENVSFVKRLDKRYQKETNSYRFWTRQFFQEWREEFYPNKKKVVPKNTQLTPLTLAVWYMDDGCLSDNRCIIATDGFCSNDIVFLQELLVSRYNIKSSLKNRSKIFIHKISLQRFFAIIDPYIIQSMRYKVFDPVTTSRKRDVDQTKISITRQYPDHLDKGIV
ncbi:MAG: hypothetical protein HY429_04640 [Candidatus Levybacteria bacterium]|nr:hypothetical protein [Candidatus Levybacteria bacterium]